MSLPIRGVRCIQLPETATTLCSPFLTTATADRPRLQRGCATLASEQGRKFSCLAAEASSTAADATREIAETAEKQLEELRKWYRQPKPFDLIRGDFEASPIPASVTPNARQKKRCLAR